MNHYFTILGVRPNATLQQIKKAYRKKVMQYHPDRNKQPGAKAKFIEIDEAYDYLCDLRSGKISQNSYVSSPTISREDKEKKRKGIGRKYSL